jgi:hypothetical protein
VVRVWATNWKISGSSTHERSFFSLECHIFFLSPSYIYQLSNLQTFQILFNCLMWERKLKYSKCESLIPPPHKMTQSAPLQIDTFRWQLSQVGYPPKKIPVDNSEKQICKCPPCNIQILIFAFQNFFEWSLICGLNFLNILSKEAFSFSKTKV